MACLRVSSTAMQTAMHAMLQAQPGASTGGNGSLRGHVVDHYQSLEAVLSSSHISQPL